MGQSSADNQKAIDVSQAAGLLAACRNPTLVVDAIDMAGARAAINLAKTANLKLDHSRSSHLPPVQEAGFICTMPGEAVERGDVVLWVGPLNELLQTDETARRMRNNNISVGANAGQPRKHFALRASSSGDPRQEGISDFDFGHRPLLESLGLLRARAEGRPIAVDDETKARIDEAIKTLKSANYGIAVFCSGALSFLEQTQLMGLVNDLSSEIRWSLLPTKLAAGQAELTRMSLALTGLTVPIAFHGGRAQHDAELHGIHETLARGESDLIVWVSASERSIPSEFTSATKTIAITANDTIPEGVDKHIRIGVGGVDHEAILEVPELGSLVSVSPINTKHDVPTAADVLNALAAHDKVNTKVIA